MSETFRLGVDIGGTFTDLVLLDTLSGHLFNEKVLTTPDDPALGVLEGTRRILERNGVAPERVANVVHGTTLVANAIIERKGADVALVTTSGFRDVLEIGTEWRYDTYDLFMELPAPLVERRHRLEVDERIGPDGVILKALDEDSVRTVAGQIRDAGISAVAICLLHSFRNPVHEQRVRQILTEMLPGAVICISSEVMPEIGEYERMSTTICNAYVLPVFERYLRRLAAGLRNMGIRRDLHLMLSDGGFVHESTATRYPIRLVQSGPAGGVQAAAIVGDHSKAHNYLCFDMGGTTAKACLVDDGKPARTTEFEVARVYRFKRGSGIPLRVPVIDMIEIGAGGGSLARVNHLGLVQVGPDSASAYPGPACYGRGGKEPTVTDADLVLGYLSADNFLGGDMRLDLDAARAAIESRIAEPLGVSVVDAAWAIHETVNESMAQAASIHALEKAQNIADYAMVPIGGAGPVHACNIALKLGVSRVMCPPSAGVASALGFLVAPPAFTFVQGGVMALHDADFTAITAVLEDLERRGRDLVIDAGVAADRVLVEVVAAMRYVGQGYDVKAVVPVEALRRGDRETMLAAFEAAYLAQYGRTEPGIPVEVVSWRVTVSGATTAIDLVAARPNVESGDAIKGERAVYFGGGQGFLRVPVFDRYRLDLDFRFEGGCVVEERESTTIIPPGSRVSVDAALNLIIELPEH